MEKKIKTTKQMLIKMRERIGLPKCFHPTLVFNIYAFVDRNFCKLLNLLAHLRLSLFKKGV